MGRVRFVPNVPQQLVLKQQEGKLVPGRWGDQMVYTLSDGRLLTISTEVAAKLNLLEIRSDEPFWICKRCTGRKGEPAEWDVWLDISAEKARALEEMGPAETELEAQLRASLAQARESSVLLVPKVGPAPDPAPRKTEFENERTADANFEERLPGNIDSEYGDRNGASQDGTHELGNFRVQPSWAQVLQSQTEALTDVYAASIQYASTRHGNAVKPEDVRALMTTAFINLAQRGRYKVA